MSAPPLRTALSDAYPNPTNAVMRTGLGAFWDYVTTLLGATGNAADARTALGLGTTSVPDFSGLNGGPLPGERQKLIGGNFTDNPWQRGTSVTFSTSGIYVADMWRVDFDGSANITVDRVALASPQVINGVWCRYGLRFTVNSKSGNSFIRLSQRIEGVDTLTTLPSTLQTVIQGSGSFSVPVAARQNFGTTGSPSSDVVTSFSSALAVTTSQQQLARGLTVPSISGKTLGTTVNNYLGIEYDLMAVPAAGNVVIALAGLEPGTIMSSYYVKRGALETAMCQRHYWRRSNLNAVYAGAGYTQPGNVASYGLLFPVPMRAIPALSQSALADLAVFDSVAGASIGSPSSSAGDNIDQYGGARAFNITCTAGRPVGFIGNSTAWVDGAATL
jgi:hypothetical protein